MQLTPEKPVLSRIFAMHLSGHSRAAVLPLSPLWRVNCNYVSEAVICHF